MHAYVAMAATADFVSLRSRVRLPNLFMSDNAISTITGRRARISSSLAGRR